MKTKLVNNGLDLTARTILMMLQKNARISFSEIGRKVDLSPSGARKRINYLESMGYIKRYTAILDQKKLGRKAGAIVNIDANFDAIPKIVERLSSLNFVDFVYRIASNNSLIVKYLADDIDELRRLIDNSMHDLIGVNRINIEIIIETFKDNNL